MSNIEFLKNAEEKLSSGLEETRYLTVKDLVKYNSIETLPLLMKATGDLSYRVREEALKGICAFPKDVIFPKLEKFLRNQDNKKLRMAAIEAFPHYGKEATPYLLRFLKDKDERIRMFSAAMLGKIGDTKAVDALIEALKDPDENVIHASAESLGKIGDKRAVKPLIDCLNQSFWIQYPAIIALGNIGDPTAIKHLIKLRDDKILRDVVAEAVRKIGGIK